MFRILAEFKWYELFLAGIVIGALVISAIVVKHDPQLAVKADIFAGAAGLIFIGSLWLRRRER